MSVREQKIIKTLSDVLQPTVLDLIDQSHKHVGHEGAKDGGGHFDLMMVSDKFEGLNIIARHRLIYDALQDMMKNEIHALSIKALAPSEQ